MSHDVYLMADLGGPEPITLPGDQNIFGPGLGVITRAMTWPLRELGGLPAWQAARMLRTGLKRIEKSPESIRSDCPDAHYVHALEFMQALADRCESAPQAQLRVTW